MDHRTVRRRAVPLITRRVLLASGVLTAILLLAFLALAYLSRAGTAGEPANKDGPPAESGQHFAAGDDGASTEDASGRVYHYRVFRKTVVGPNASGITKPVPGKSVVSLQTCTLPDYKDRLIVQAELIGVAHGDRQGERP
jgi:hypothetical protein